MKCWSPWCPSEAMSALDERVCHIHAIRYVIRGEPLPLSIVPLQELVRKMMQRQHPTNPYATWTRAHVAEELGVSLRSVERLITGTGGQAHSLWIPTAEKWAERFGLHPIDIWGDAYTRHAYEVAA